MTWPVFCMLFSNQLTQLDDTNCIARYVRYQVRSAPYKHLHIIIFLNHSFVLTVYIEKHCQYDSENEDNFGRHSLPTQPGIFPFLKQNTTSVFLP